MIVYHKTKKQFLQDASDNIEDIIRQQVALHLGITVQENGSEHRSWKNSIGDAMFKVMNTDRIPDDASVAIEYSIPRTRNRIDFIVSGLDELGHDSVVVIELKQWDKVEVTNKDAVVKTRFQGSLTETLHPSYQAWSYVSLIQDYNETVYSSDSINLYPSAYLHNLKDRAIIGANFYKEYLKKAPAFFKGDKEKLQDFIARFVKTGDRNNVLYQIESSRVRPSKELADSLASMLQGNQEFILIDDQKLVFEEVVDFVNNTPNDEKRVLIVEGGPGTGKSVVAFNLLSKFLHQGLNTHYITKNAAPRAVFEAKLTGSMKRSKINHLLQGSGQYCQSEKNEMDVLLIDEAHRLAEKSGIFRNKGENQVKELINASRVSVFFIDEDQRVTWQDIGSKNEIKRWANEFGAKVSLIKLHTQFRCNGSNGYLAWLDNTLQIRPTANPSLEGINYDFKIFDNPQELWQAIVSKNKRNKSRLVAGYCWDWISKKNMSDYDIQFPEFDFAMKWNLTEDGSKYLIAKDSVNQVGCIHTCQGLDLEYVGVIIGPDLIVRNGVVQTVPSARAKTDQSLKGYKKALREGVAGTENKADAIIRNTYRTLMSRGLKGCYVYFTDKETEKFFRLKMVQV